MSEIVTKAKDAALMFWQALTDEERRLMVFYGCYVSASAWGVLRTKARHAERALLRDEILQELRA